MPDQKRSVSMPSSRMIGVRRGLADLLDAEDEVFDALAAGVLPAGDGRGGGERRAEVDERCRRRRGCASGRARWRRRRGVRCRWRGRRGSSPSCDRGAAGREAGEVRTRRVRGGREVARRTASEGDTAAVSRRVSQSGMGPRDHCPVGPDGGDEACIEVRRVDSGAWAAARNGSGRGRRGRRRRTWAASS